MGAGRHPAKCETTEASTAHHDWIDWVMVAPSLLPPLLPGLHEHKPNKTRDSHGERKVAGAW